MNALTRVLEEARALQLRLGVTTREALALAMANLRRSGDMAESVDDGGARMQMPAASRLDALLPRDREPSIEEIREAWKESIEQSGPHGGDERGGDVAVMSAGHLVENW